MGGKAPGNKNDRNMSKDTLEFIKKLYEEKKAENPALDYDSFVAGAKAVVEHLTDKL